MTVIGDNYETSVIFIVSGFQYIATAMAYNFGYEFRQGWWRNYLFVLASFAFIFLHFYATLKPGYLSCFWRLNCDNEHVVNGVTNREKTPIQNRYNTTVMPQDFRIKLVAIMVANLVSIMLYEYFIVNGLRRRWSKMKKMSTTASVAPRSTLSDDTC